MDRDSRAHYTLPMDRLETAKRKLKLAAVIQFTMPGSPTIYYGDEAGRQGFEDPFNRRTYPWGAEDRELLAFYRRLCALRADSETLLHYERVSDHARLHILVNRGHHAVETRVDAVYAVDMLENAEFDRADSRGVYVTIPPETAYILRCFGTPLKED